MARKAKVVKTKTQTRKPRASVKVNGVSSAILNEHTTNDTVDSDARADVLRTCAQIIGVIAQAAVNAPNNRDIGTSENLRRLQS